MMIRKASPILLAVSALFFLCPCVKAQDGGFYLHAGDHVLFYGDSITDQRLYTQIIETYATTRYPNLNVTYTNSGWGGDRVSGGGGGDIDTRLSRDVAPYRPSVVTIMLGMNDGNYKPASAATDETFFRGYTHIVDTVRKDAPQVRITAIEPSPYDNVTRPAPMADTEGYNQVLVGFSKWIANYAQQNNLTVADANTEFVADLRKADQLNARVAEQIVPDHIHPSFGGAMLLAEAVLKAWQARDVVASVTLDASAGKPKLKNAQHAQVTVMMGNAGEVSWSETDDALPLPFAQWRTMWGGGPTVGLAIQSSDITDALNHEPLRVIGLKRGNYKLAIDAQEIGMYTDTQLAESVDLGPVTTPMSDQAMSVYKLITEHNELHYARWRSVQVPLASYNFPNAQNTMDALDTLDAAVFQQARKEAQPKAHTFTLTLIQ